MATKTKILLAEVLKNSGEAQAIFKGKNEVGINHALIFTEENLLIVKTGDAQRVVSYSEAQDWAEEHGFCSPGIEFDFYLHSPSGSFDDIRPPEEAAFTQRRLTLSENRFSALLDRPVFQKCIVMNGSTFNAVHLTPKDTKAINDMLIEERDDYGYSQLGFSARIKSLVSASMAGHWVNGEGNCVEFDFWHSETSSSELLISESLSEPHTWIKIGDRIELSDEGLRTLAICAIKAIITYQVKSEMCWGRDPHRILREYPGSPTEWFGFKRFKDSA